MLDDLDHAYRLSYLIGEIVRNDVWAESEMRSVWRALHDAHLPVGEMQRNFGYLVKQVRTALRLPSIPHDFQVLALEVIEATHAVHQMRNTVAHDLLIQDHFDSNLVRSMRTSAPPRPFAELQAISADLMTMAWRLRGIWVIAPSWIGGASEDDGNTRESLLSWTRVAMGHIRDDVPNAILGTPGDAPEPPGGYR
ncbi:hypothetical protein ACFVWR_14350 [Leifsonia sp. NPDC058292]|uniref:hypothetical protein n=1 Tax=Leifsonia sp. NPDC058292 TaxID=3346428 RepID=UPI0036D8D8D3